MRALSNTGEEQDEQHSQPRMEDSFTIHLGTICTVNNTNNQV